VFFKAKITTHFDCNYINPHYILLESTLQYCISVWHIFDSLTCFALQALWKSWMKSMVTRGLLCSCVLLLT